MAKKTITVKTKNELVKALIDDSGVELSQAASKKVIDSLFGLLKRSIKANERFVVSGFGTFRVKKRAARKGINPKTKAVIKIKQSKTVSFKPAPDFKKGL